jgi:hypothetical protein
MKNQHGLQRNALIAILGASLLAGGCVVRERVVYRPPPPYVGGEVEVGTAPPPPLVETVTVAPDPAFIWVGGVWVWGGGGWRWEGGHWGRPPHPGAIWVPHRYEYRGGRHVWVRGGWR